MKILSPAASAREVTEVIQAGAGEIYCGVMPSAWKRAYTNMASPNRREWEVSNMRDFEELAEAVGAAHSHGVPIFLTLNALYTEGQYDGVEEFVHQATRTGVDAVIVADVGVLVQLRDMGWQGLIHVSTGGTTFNRETIGFYRDLGADRVILPRQNRLGEITAMAEAERDIELETFILNRGCKNIDGFCTFHHGVNEVRVPLWWRIPKRMHMDYYLLSLMKRLPARWRDRLGRSSAFGSVGACFLAYDVDVKATDVSSERRETLAANLRRNFNLFTGFDTCGACALFDLKRAGIHSLKIVGRSNPLPKKVRDVRFLATCMDHLESEGLSKAAFGEFVRKEYERVYGFACHRWCYYPAEDSAMEGGAL